MTEDTKAALETAPYPGILPRKPICQTITPELGNIDCTLVSLCKRCFIASNALKSGEDRDVIEKIGLYQQALNDYLSVVDETLYEPLDSCQQKVNDKERLEKISMQFGKIKKRLSRFSQRSAKSAVAHRVLFAKALCRIDSLVIQHHTSDRDFLYPLYG